MQAVKSYIEEFEVPCEWRSVTGCRSFWSDELFERAKGDIEKLGEVNPEMAGLVRVIEKGDVEGMKREKVNGNASGVTLTRGAGQLWPYKYVGFIVEKLVREGKVNLQTNTPVTKIEVSDTDGNPTNTNTHPITLHTPRGSIRSRHVLLATNGYTSALLPSYTDLLVPVRCEMSALHPPKNSTRLPNSYGMVGYGNGNPHHDDYLVQRPFYPSPNGDGSQRGGHLMFGGGRTHAMYNCIGESEDDIVDPGEAAYLRKTLLGALELDGEVEELKELRASHQWTGIKGYSRDNMPWVGKVPVSTSVVDAEGTGREEGDVKFHDNLWLCGGYTGHGMPNATLCGKALVKMVLAEMDGKDDKQTHEAVCENLVKDGDLPRSYLITADRLKKAVKLPSVAEQEGEGKRGEREFALVGGGNREGKELAMEERHAGKKEKEAKEGEGRCVAM